MLEDQLDYIVGVDPHRDEHAVAVVEVVSGAVVSVGVKTLCPRPRSERATPVHSQPPPQPPCTMRKEVIARVCHLGGVGVGSFAAPSYLAAWMTSVLRSVPSAA